MNKIELIQLKKRLSLIKQGVNDEIMLLEILKVFPVPLDTSRLSDYTITKYELDEKLKQLVIEITDTKTGAVFEVINTEYSKITGRAYTDDGDRFNTIIVKNGDVEHNLYYYAGKKHPSLEEATIRHGEYYIFLSQSEPFVIRGWNKFDCDYFLISFGACDKNLLNLKYTTNYKVIDTKSFGQVVVNDDLALSDKLNCPNRYYYEKQSGSIISGNMFKCPKWYIDGACFEEFDKKAFENLFYNQVGTSPLHDYNAPAISSESFIIYKGYSFLETNSYAHIIAITKTNDGIEISYSAKDRDMRNKAPINLEVNFTIPISSTGKINTNEVKALIVELQNRFPDDEFICFIIGELEAFIRRIAIRDGLEEEVLSAIDPKVLYGMSFDNIIELISSNKDYYFSLLQEIFVKETGKKSDELMRELKKRKDSRDKN